MSNRGSIRKFIKANLFPVFGIVILITMIAVVYRFFWYKRQCDIIYNEVNSSVVECGMKVHAKYQGQKVEISQANINRVINSVTDRLVYFASADEMPQKEPIILEFGDILLMEIYPATGYEVFVKHQTQDKTSYYIIKDTCNFDQLRKVVSVDEWSSPNILINE